MDVSVRLRLGRRKHTRVCLRGSHAVRSGKCRMFFGKRMFRTSYMEGGKRQEWLARSQALVFFLGPIIEVDYVSQWVNEKSHAWRTAMSGMGRRRLGALDKDFSRTSGVI